MGQKSKIDCKGVQGGVSDDRYGCPSERPHTELLNPKKSVTTPCPLLPEKQERLLVFWRKWTANLEPYDSARD